MHYLKLEDFESLLTKEKKLDTFSLKGHLYNMIGFRDLDQESIILGSGYVPDEIVSYYSCNEEINSLDKSSKRYMLCRFTVELKKGVTYNNKEIIIEGQFNWLKDILKGNCDIFYNTLTMTANEL